MKNHKKQWRFCLFFLLFLYLLLFPEPARLGACDGLLLWYRSVLPVLFPFMLLSAAALRTGAMAALPAVFQKFIRNIFKCSRNGCFAVIIGFFCGFPMGAKITADLLAQKKINDQEAKHLLGFVNNVSPVFLTSFLAAQQLERPGLSICFLCSTLGAALLYGAWTAPKSILPSDKADTSRETDAKNNSMYTASADASDRFVWIDEVINDSVYSMVKLGVCIMVFSMIGSGIFYFWKNGGIPSLVLRSCIEVTGGIQLICSSALTLPQKYTALSALCAFGGLSALIQTIAVAKLSPQLVKYYIKSRVIITLLAVLLSCFILFFFRGLFL